MAYWSGLAASIKALKVTLAAETDARMAARIAAEIADKQAVLASRRSAKPS